MYFGDERSNPGEMRRYQPERPKHLLRSTWTKNLRVDYPEDWGLAITQELILPWLGLRSFKSWKVM